MTFPSVFQVFLVFVNELQTITLPSSPSTVTDKRFLRNKPISAITMPSSIARCKCVILGDAGVGKTAIVKSLIGHPHSFPSTYTMTPGVEIFVKSIRSSTRSDALLEFFIYDFSGKSIYADLVRNLWSNNVTIVVGVFDVNREDSFFSLQTQLTELLKQFDNPDEIIGIILGNKTDLKGRRSVSSEDAHQLAKKYKMRYFDVSAKESKSQIEEAFLYLTNLWLDTHFKHYTSSSPRPSVTFKTDNQMVNS